MKNLTLMAALFAATLGTGCGAGAQEKFAAKGSGEDVVGHRRVDVSGVVKSALCEYVALLHAS